MLTFFEPYDLLVCSTSVAPAFDVTLRNRIAIDGDKLETYIAGSDIGRAKDRQHSTIENHAVSLPQPYYPLNTPFLATPSHQSSNMTSSGSSRIALPRSPPISPVPVAKPRRPPDACGPSSIPTTCWCARPPSRRPAT